MDRNGRGVFYRFYQIEQSFVVDETKWDLEVRRKVQYMLIVEFRVCMAPSEAGNYCRF